jgi:hypothetical protein
MRARWADTALPESNQKPAPGSLAGWMRLNTPAKVGYLFGDPAGRKKFESLAERAWLALPGTQEGKAQAFPQPRAVERWLAFVYRQLEHAASSYLAADDELLAVDHSEDGQTVEQRFLPALVQHGNYRSTGYPEAEALSDRARRWVVTALATDPFAASAVAIEMLLADPDPVGPFLISWQEFDAYQKSPAFQKANFLVDAIILGEGRRFPIYRYWCNPAPGPSPSICPNADPPSDQADREALMAFLPQIEQRFRELNLVGENQTIHWVGRQARLGTRCKCVLHANATSCQENAHPATVKMLAAIRANLQQLRVEMAAGRRPVLRTAEGSANHLVGDDSIFLLPDILGLWDELAALGLGEPPAVPTGWAPQEQRPPGPVQIVGIEQIGEEARAAAFNAPTLAEWAEMALVAAEQWLAQKLGRQVEPRQVQDNPTKVGEKSSNGTGEELASGAQTSASSSNTAPEIDQEAQALALLFQNPEWSIARIADQLHVDRKTPYKWPKFRKAAEMDGRLKPRGKKEGSPRRGHKTSDGRVEAYVDEDEDD